MLSQSNANRVVYQKIHDPVFCREEAGEGCNLRKSLSQMPAGESGNFFAAFLHLLPVLLFFCLHQRSKQQKDAFAQTFLRPAVAKLLPGVRVAAFDVLVVDAVVAGNDVVCIEYTAHLVVHL